MRYSRFTQEEIFEQDLHDSGHSHNVTLSADIARKLLRECHTKMRAYGKHGYRQARFDTLVDALISCEIDDPEWDGYKDFIDRRFLRRAWEANSIKHRPFAPLDAE